MAELAALQAVIHGRVQGVFYRSFVARHAAQLDIRGFVRNTPDGAVEVYAEGERGQLEKLLEHLRRGPPAAKVERVDTVWSERAGAFPDFRVR
ncbi:MAG: acylphosphatase [Chloroflexi bacterium]|nr:acylphosphatase [Chloroflexota bacterium]